MENCENTFDNIKDTLMGFGKHKEVSYETMVNDKKYHRYIDWIYNKIKEPPVEGKKSFDNEKIIELQLLHDEYLKSKKKIVNSKSDSLLSKVERLEKLLDDQRSYFTELLYLQDKRIHKLESKIEDL